ncbi:oxidoreductase [Mycobacterium sp. PDNC021]|uniref:oxidoreductase n=1 Tax=Mycobacterium sp. PDNC021 TaxID=3391399 RepID=UPI003AACD4FC
MPGKVRAASTFRTTDIPDQSGKVILVTGANNGLGLQAATALARAGARVLLACRNQETGKRALELVTAVNADADHTLIQLDLGDLSSVRAAAEQARSAAPAIDVLINNAGLMAVPFGRTADGFEMQIGINHLGHFAFTDAVLPALLKAPTPRVITLSSIGHKRGRIVLDDLNFDGRRYVPLVAYYQSKLANVLFSSELARRSEKSGATIVSVGVHPGLAATTLVESIAPPIPGMVALMRLGTRMIANSEEQGALSQLYAATMPDVENGDYLGPNGIGDIRGPVGHSARSSAACDENLAVQLWERSIELTGAQFSELN